MSDPVVREPVVVIHGGAWAIPDKLSSASVTGVCAAARAGYEVLVRGGSAVDAVEAAVRVMEDCPAFDAGIAPPTPIKKREAHDLYRSPKNQNFTINNQRNKSAQTMFIS